MLKLRSSRCRKLCDLDQELRQPALRRLLRAALDEDIGSGDITTKALLPATCRVEAVILAKMPMVISGLPAARAVFRMLDSGLRIQLLRRDSSLARPGETLIRLEGKASSILAGERLALNILQRMSGIATLTSRFVRRVGANGPVILDTRKTAPGLRVLDKYAVACGGGVNHRMGLYDQILIKDNHRSLWKTRLAGSMACAVSEARRKYPGRIIEVEVETLADLRDAIRAKPDWVLLDNMTPARLRRCVHEVAGRCRVEASGGITLRNAAKIAATGVDAISLGCLTHSAPAADISLELLLPGQLSSTKKEMR